jgi:hypothetical protein
VSFNNPASTTVSKLSRHTHLVPFADRLRNQSTAMIWWGLTAGVVVALLLLVITPKIWPTNDSRGLRLRDAMLVLEHGGPLLLGRHGVKGSLYSVDFGDDAGSYIYIPLLTRLFGLGDPVAMYRYIYVALVSVTTSIYPLVVYRLTRSLLAGFAAPMMLVVCMLSMGFYDIYWIPAWGVLTLLPLIFILARGWSRFSFPALVAISLIAGWMSSIRSNSGLGIAIAAAIVLLMRRWRWWRVLPSLAVLILVYISINTFVINAIRTNRNHHLPMGTLQTGLTAAHPLWHTAYAGYGYIPNKYGLRFGDGVPNARVQREAPGTPFLSSHYEAIVEKAYFKLLLEHPVETARQYAAKTVVVIADTSPYILIALLTLPAMLLVGSDRHNTRRWILLTIPAAVLAFLPIMIGVPYQVYEQGLYGVIGVTGILGLCLLLGDAEASIRERRRLRGTSDVGTPWTPYCERARTQSTRVSVVLIAILVAFAFAGYFLREESNRWQGGKAGVLMEHVRF